MRPTVPPFQNAPLTDFSKPENERAMREALSRVEDELGKEYPLIIGGERVKAKETFPSICPSHKDTVVGTFQKATEQEAEKAMQAALAAFERWSRVSPEDRAKVLFRAAEIMRKRRLELAAWMVWETGKNWVEADADVVEAIDYLEYYGREMLRLGEGVPLVPMPGTANYYFYIPLGVVVVIPPWNFPLAILLGMTTAAVVTGNTVVLKPASDSPAIGYKFMEVMEEAGLPPGVINYITGPGSIAGEYLVKHPQTRMIAFTGSKEVGIRIYENAAKVVPGQKWLKRVIAEMGGKDPIIIDGEILSLEEAVRGVVVSAYGYQGQKCSANSRLIIVKDMYEKFLEALVEEVKKIEVGPAEENYFMGPVINERAKNTILEYIKIGKGEAKLVVGGNPLMEDMGYYIEPTVFRDVPEDARIFQEEIFGPVLSVSVAKDFDDALRMANNSVYGLTGALYSAIPEHIEKARREFHVGNLYINRKCTGAIVGVEPFGGFNMSGTDSKAGGPDYLLLFMQGKTVSERIWPL